MYEKHVNNNTIINNRITGIIKTTELLRRPDILQWKEDLYEFSIVTIMTSDDIIRYSFDLYVQYTNPVNIYIHPVTFSDYQNAVYYLNGCK
jgi:hypothetical protein